MTSDALPLDRIHDLSANYSDRQGLRTAPIAVALMVEALPRAVSMPALALPVDPMLCTLVVGLTGYYLVGRYYRHRFGTVEEMPHEGVPIALQIGLVMFCLMVSVSIDIVGNPPVFLSGLVIAGWLIATSWPSRHIRKEYFLMGAFLAGLSIYEPLIGEKQSHVASSYAFLFGFLLLMAGVRDHIEFVRSFPANGDAA